MLKMQINLQFTYLKMQWLNITYCDVKDLNTLHFKYALNAFNNLNNLLYASVFLVFNSHEVCIFSSLFGFLVHPLKASSNTFGISHYIPFIHAQYIYQDSKLLAPVVYFSDPLFMGRLGRPKCMVTRVYFCPRPAGKETNKTLRKRN